VLLLLLQVRESCCLLGWARLQWATPLNSAACHLKHMLLQLLLLLLLPTLAQQAHLVLPAYWVMPRCCHGLQCKPRHA
jgi:hypothetical protein